MKTILTLLTVLTCVQFSFAQAKQYPQDTSANIKPLLKTGNLFIRLQSRNAFGMIKPGMDTYNFKSMFGTGAELMVGFKLHEKTALGFGLQRTHFFLNQAHVEKALTETYTSPWMSAEVIDKGKSSLIQKAFFIYASGWKQKKHAVFEYYTKLSLTSFQYDLNSNVNRQADFPDRTILVSYDGGISNTGFMAGAGMNYSVQISKVFYLGGGLEYNFNAMPKTYLYETNVSTTDPEVTYQIELPTPSHFVQLNFGLMYKPNKPCNCKNRGLDGIR